MAATEQRKWWDDPNRKHTSERVHKSHARRGNPGTRDTPIPDYVAALCFLVAVVAGIAFLVGESGAAAVAGVALVLGALMVIAGQLSRIAKAKE